MNYWHLQLHPGEFESWNVKEIKEILEQGLIGCSGDPIVDFNKIEPEDVVLIRHGGIVIALVKVVSKAFDMDPEIKTDYLWFDRACEIELLEFYSNERISGEGWFLPKTLMPVTNDIASNYIRLKYLNHLNRTMIADIKSLLQYKKQIILQGPPGTGKTRLAKELAKELTTNSKKINARDLILNFFKEFNPDEPQNKYEFDRQQELLNQFYHCFPKEKLGQLTLESYAIGTGANNSFCWWIERGLKHLGYYFPGSARSYLLYYKKEMGDYSIHGKFLKQGYSPQETMLEIAELIGSLILKKNFDKARLYFGDGFLLKLLHSYYPDEYFPVNSVPCLENILKLFKEEHLGLNALEMNLKIQSLFDNLKTEYGSAATNHDFMRFLFDEFNIKGKLEIVEDDVVNRGEYKLVQFHPSYSYEDFVRGITIEIEENLPNYIVKNKILASFADLALNNPLSNYVLIIDEINRANLSAVLGELIYALEYRYDKEKPDENIVESMYSLKLDDQEGENGHALRLPKNLYIIGTMNTADRSVGHIDYAVRRRFAFVDVPSKDLSLEMDSKQFHKQLYEQVADFFVTNLSPEFEKKDVQLGHSYFIDKTSDGGSMSVRLQYEIKPILMEYVKDGILIGDSILKSITELSV